ncbi:glycosyltransferase family 4 protein [Hamadaea sp. NPDC050747]|uniref:glycosyltransferase family 4 protein n=1 Tax=Hamadaea sp. NPDC050747 TaxID=3155789 RepID=UPI0033C877F5
MPSPLRIAMLAPPYYDIPPSGYGGIEIVVADLTDALVARGHEVTLIGAGSDGTAGEFRRTFAEPQSDRLGEPMPEVMHAAMAARLLDDLDVDIVHDHTLAGPLTAAGRRVPTVATMHGPLDGEPGEYYRQFGKDLSLVAISESQRSHAADLNWVATVYNGLQVADYPFRETKEDWVLFLGRFAEDKGADLAIKAAREAGRPLVLAGKMNEPAEEAYFDEVVRPLLGSGVTYVGEADAALKRELYAKASCLLFPIRWPEPFGMVMIEAMACGTPVVALAEGSVPEVVDHGRTGFVCAEPAELAAALDRLPELTARDCRVHVEQRFDVATMAAGYEEVYRSVLG